MEKIDLRKIRYTILSYSPCCDLFVQFGRSKHTMPFDLSKEDIRLTERLLARAFRAYNKQVQKDFDDPVCPFPNFGKIEDFLLEPSCYYRQYVTAIDENGIKKVYVNAIHKELAKDIPNWKSEVISIFDGRNAVFGCLINLSKKRAGKGWCSGYFY